MSQNQEGFNNNEVEFFPIPPLLPGHSSVHYLLVRSDVSSKFGITAIILLWIAAIHTGVFRSFRYRLLMDDR